MAEKTPEETLAEVRAAVALNAFCFGLWAKEGDTEINVDREKVEEFLPGMTRAIAQLDKFDAALAEFNTDDPVSDWLKEQIEEVETLLNVEGVRISLVKPLARIIVGKLIELRKAND